jgi:nitrogenase molybdenum-cofactor synthesis protein NifE
MFRRSSSAASISFTVLPAALAFNSPGAQGFGVKRAGLAVPGSVMLLVSPGCCGRNTTALRPGGDYDGRMFYLLLDDTDIVTGGT